MISPLSISIQIRQFNFFVFKFTLEGQRFNASQYVMGCIGNLHELQFDPNRMAAMQKEKRFKMAPNDHLIDEMELPPGAD